MTVPGASRQLGFLVAWVLLSPTWSLAAFADVTQRQQAKPTVDEILGDWSSRRSQFTSGIVEWTITRQTRSETFGSPVTERTVRVLFDRRGFRLESQCPPAAGVVSARVVFDRDPLGKANSHTRFHTSLGSRFRLLQDDVPQQAQSYVFLREADRDVHLWNGEAGLPLFVGMFPLGAGPEYIDAPTCSLLVDALLHALHLVFPAAGDRGTRDFHLKPEHPLVRGRRCVVLEERRPGRDADGDTSLEFRRYWVDPSRDHLVLRTAVSTGEGVLKRQFDFEYASDERADDVPDQIELMQLSGPHVVHDVLSVTRTSVELGVPLPDNTFSWEFIPETFVTDFINRQQYVVLEDGEKRFITSNESAWAGTSVEGSQVLPFLGRLVLKSVTWPGILLTMPIILTVYAVIRSQGLSHRVPNVESDATDHMNGDPEATRRSPSESPSSQDE